MKDIKTNRIEGVIGGNHKHVRKLLAVALEATVLFFDEIGEIVIAGVRLQ